MIEINATTLYSREDLRELLAPLGIDADGWIERLKPVKKFRMAWWGADLIRAINKAAPIGSEEGQAGPARRPRRRRSGRGKGLIGGVFSPEEVGLGECGSVKSEG